MKWPIWGFNRHLIEENDWLRHQHTLLQAKLDRLESAVWAQQSPAGAAYSATTVTRQPLESPAPTVNTWQQFEQSFYDTQSKEEETTT